MDNGEKMDQWSEKELKLYLDTEAKLLEPNQALFKREVQRVLKKGAEIASDHERGEIGEARIFAHKELAVRMAKISMTNGEEDVIVPDYVKFTIARELHGLRTSRLAAFIAAHDPDLVSKGIKVIKHDVMIPYYSADHKTMTATLMPYAGELSSVPEDVYQERLSKLDPELERRMNKFKGTREVERTSLHKFVEAKGIYLEGMENIRIDSEGKIWIVESGLHMDLMEDLAVTVAAMPQAQEGFQLIADALATKPLVGNEPDFISFYLSHAPQALRSHIQERVKHLLVLRTQKYRAQNF